jgi:tRNA 2-thiocytidine biosynthesis protein TtcA
MSKQSNNIRKQVTKALNDFNMISEGDRIMVACSGGKDSSILLLILEKIRKKSPVKFTLHPVMLDQK